MYHTGYTILWVFIQNTHLLYHVWDVCNDEFNFVYEDGIRRAIISNYQNVLIKYIFSNYHIAYSIMKIEDQCNGNDNRK